MNEVPGRRETVVALSLYSIAWGMPDMWPTGFLVSPGAQITGLAAAIFSVLHYERLAQRQVNTKERNADT